MIETCSLIDEGSNAMLAGLVDSIAGTNTLAVLNFRPEYSPGWAGSSSYRVIALEPLARADTRELLRDLAGEDRSLTASTSRSTNAPRAIRHREIVRELAEAGT